MSCGWVIDDAKGDGSCLRMAAEAIVEYRLGPVEHGEPDPFSTLRAVAAAALDQRGGLGLATSEGSERDGGVGNRRAPDRLHRRVDLTDELLGGAELAGEDVDEHPLGEGERELAERAGLAGEPHVAIGQRQRVLVIPDVLRGRAGQPQPAQLLRRRPLISLERPVRPAQDRDGRRKSLGEQRRQAVEQHVGRA
jgi:hypothetical protein